MEKQPEGNQFTSKFGLDEFVTFLSNDVKIPARIRRVCFSLVDGITYDIVVITKGSDGLYRYSAPIGGVAASSLVSMNDTK